MPPHQGAGRGNEGGLGGVTFDSLPRYPLCYVLGFLAECDGTSSLLTCRRLAHRTLPVFAVRSGGTLRVRSAGNGGGGAWRPPRTRHRFQGFPAQDPDVLLARLNTRRLRQRMARLKRRAEGGSAVPSAYASGHSTEVLAELEWENALRLGQGACEGEGGASFPWPTDLELLFWGGGGFQPPLEPCAGWEGSSGRSSDPIILASYPRSGNTLLRNLFERALLRVTGSDTRPDRTLSRALALRHNLVGEGVVRTGPAEPAKAFAPSSAAVGMVKTHYPERKGYLPFVSSRVILLVRNPWDAIDSYWNLCLTNTHTETVAEEVYRRYADKFRDLAVSEMKTWTRFHHWWLEQCRDQGVDVCTVRYEDLVLDCGRTFRQVMRFALGVDELSEFWEARVRHALNEGAGEGGDQDTACLGSYRPRSDGGGDAHRSARPSPEQAAFPPSIGKAIRKGRYSGETLSLMHDAAASSDRTGRGDDGEMMVPLLQRFGYDIFKQDFPKTFAPGMSGGSTNGTKVVLRQKGEPLVRPIKVNAGATIRPSDDPFGRAMTAWRKGETAGDTAPFPTVART